MGVKLKKYKGKWYLFIDYNGKRKAKCLGTDRKLAESIKRQVEAKLVLGDLGLFGTEEVAGPSTVGSRAGRPGHGYSYSSDYEGADDSSRISSQPSRS